MDSLRASEYVSGLTYILKSMNTIISSYQQIARELDGYSNLDSIKSNLNIEKDIENISTILFPQIEKILSACEKYADIIDDIKLNYSPDDTIEKSVFNEKYNIHELHNFHSEIDTTLGGELIKSLKKLRDDIKSIAGECFSEHIDNFYSDISTEGKIIH